MYRTVNRVVENCSACDCLMDGDVRKHKNTWSLGYGELTLGSVKRLFDYMTKGAPENLRMGPGSSFLDIGSGYGKVVFYANMTCPQLKEVTGIECLPFRHSRSVQLMEKLQPSLSKDVPIKLLCADASEFDSFPHSHIYSFDKVFSDTTREALLPAIIKSSPKLFVTFKRLQCPQFKLVHRMRCRTTGKETMTALFYTSFF